MQTFLAFERVLNRTVSALASLALVAAVACGFFQVVTRFVLEQPSTWSEAATRTLLIWMVFLGSMAAFRHGALVSVDLAYRLSSGRWRLVLHSLISSASMVLLGIVIWYGYQMTMRVRFQVLAGVEISIAWAYAALPVGAAFALIGVLAHWIDHRPPDLETTTR